MRKKIELRKPLKINNELRKTLDYDFEELTCDAYTKAFGYAEAMTTQLASSGHASATVMEYNGTLHMYLAAQAIIAVNPEIDITDIERIKGFDLVTLTTLGRNFIFGKSEDNLDQSSLEEESEDIPVPSAQA